MRVCYHTLYVGISERINLFPTMWHFCCMKHIYAFILLERTSKMNNLREFQEIIGYKFTNEKYLRNALTHSSYAHENMGKKVVFNERLEFLGDSVLSLIVSKYIYENYPELPEGKLTKMRAAVVCEKSLFECALNIDLGKYLILGRGEDRTGGRTRPSILSDAYEALIAAIFLDSNLDVVREWVLGQLHEAIEAASKGKISKDYKTEFQELAQAQGDVNIHYKIAGSTGPDHNKSFVVEVYLNDALMGEGEGSSKKKAEQNAAKNAILKLNKDK